MNSTDRKITDLEQRAAKIAGQIVSLIGDSNWKAYNEGVSRLVAADFLDGYTPEEREAYKDRLDAKNLELLVGKDEEVLELIAERHQLVSERALILMRRKGRPLLCQINENLSDLIKIDKEPTLISDDEMMYLFGPLHNRAQDVPFYSVGDIPLERMEEFNGAVKTYTVYNKDRSSVKFIYMDKRAAAALIHLPHHESPFPVILEERIYNKVRNFLDDLVGVASSNIHTVAVLSETGIADLFGHTHWIDEMIGS